MISKDFYNFAFMSLYTHKSKYLAPFLLFFIIVFLICSVLFISSSLKFSALLAIEGEPQILVENYHGGTKSKIDDFYIEEISKIKGVSKIIPRVSGRYYFEQAKVYFTIIGLDFFAPNFHNEIDELTSKKINLSNQDLIFIGSGVKNTLSKFAYQDELTLFSFEGEAKSVKIEVLDDSEYTLMSHNVILCDTELAKMLLGMEKFEYSDLFVDVPNETEVPNITALIRTAFPNTRITSKEDKIAQIHNLYYYKGGLFLALFIVSIVSFMILLYQKTIFSFASEKREIGILRAIGWRISDIIKLKIIQNLFISLSAFCIAMIGAYIFVFVLGAPLLKNIFLGNDSLAIHRDFIPIFSFGDILILLFVTVVPFMASVLLPSWKLSTIDPTEVMK